MARVYGTKLCEAVVIPVQWGYCIGSLYFNHAPMVTSLLFSRNRMPLPHVEHTQGRTFIPLTFQSTQIPGGDEHVKQI